MARVGPQRHRKQTNKHETLVDGRRDGLTKQIVLEHPSLLSLNERSLPFKETRTKKV